MSSLRDRVGRLMKTRRQREVEEALGKAKLSCQKQLLEDRLARTPPRLDFARIMQDVAALQQPEAQGPGMWRWTNGNEAHWRIHDNRFTVSPWTGVPLPPPPPEPKEMEEWDEV